MVMIPEASSFTRYKCTIEPEDLTHLQMHINVDKTTKHDVTLHATPPPHAEVQQCKLTQTSNLKASSLQSKSGRVKSQVLGQWVA